MKLTKDQENELAKFPSLLKKLVEAELAAGNQVVEVGHSFPAPPVGAYIKLANRITTQVRQSSDGIGFFERNSSSYSGEFADDQRHYFVLEPPNPPPVEPNMDMIRQSMCLRTDPFSYEKSEPEEAIELIHSTNENQTNGGSSNEEVDDEEVDDEEVDDVGVDSEIVDDEGATVTAVDSDFTASRKLYFRDRRPPHEVQFALEKEIMTLFQSSLEDNKLLCRAQATVVGAKYHFQFVFEAAYLLTNCYSLEMITSWGEQTEANRDYYRNSCNSWFKMWTRDLKITSQPKDGGPYGRRYRQLCNESLAAQNRYESIPAIQQAILMAMKKGAMFNTSHKEGGTNISWQAGRFIRSDYGDYTDLKKFDNEAKFWEMLYVFYFWDVARNFEKDQLSEFDRWKLILRRMSKS